MSDSTLAAIYDDGLHIGDQVIDSNGNIHRVSAFCDERDGLHVVLENWGSIAISRFQPKSDGSREFYRLDKPLEELEAEAVRALMAPPVTEPEQPSMALTTVASGNQVKAVRALMQAQIDRVGMQRAVLQRKLNAMNQTVSEMRTAVRYMTRVISMVETYLGVYEEVYRLSPPEALPASAEEPITIRQMILAMDEEIGDISLRNGVRGIDIRRVEDFDTWVMAGNWKMLVPEEKCVVALCPSRQQRVYSTDTWANIEMNDQNRFTYILIRNGERFYRIWTGLKLGARLFPTAQEWDALMRNIEKYDRPPEHLKEAEMAWQEKIILLQGLFERTDVIQPVAGPINLFDPVTFEQGRVRMVRDAETVLGPGLESFRVWQKRTNAELRRGSRVYLGTIPDGYRSADWSDRLPAYFVHNFPPLPKPDIYTVEEVQAAIRQQPECLKILYAPEDDIFDREEWTFRQRQHRISFDLHRSDDFIINYEALTLELVDYWIHNRAERGNYLTILPLMIWVRQELEAEALAEQQFAELMANREGIPLSAIQDAIRWWKTKTIKQRPVQSDEQKAWRMIIRAAKKTSRQGPEKQEPIAGYGSDIPTNAVGQSVTDQT